MHVFDELLDDAERDEWQSLQQVSELVVRNRGRVGEDTRLCICTAICYINYFFSDSCKHVYVIVR